MSRIRWICAMTAHMRDLGNFPSRDHQVVDSDRLPPGKSRFDWSDVMFALDGKVTRMSLVCFSRLLMCRVGGLSGNPKLFSILC